MESPQPLGEAPAPVFEEALTNLEQIVQDLEEGTLGLEETLARYEQGVKLLRQCHSFLERTERRIELLSGVDAQGNPVTQAFDDSTQTLEEKAENRGNRRTAAPDSTVRRVASAGRKRRAGTGEIDEPGQLF